MADNNVSLEEQIVVSANEAIKALENIKKSVKGVKNETSSAGSLIKKGLGAIGATFSLKKTLNFLKDANKSAMDLVETANLFEVSMGKGVQGLTQYYERAIKFQNDLSEKLGTNLNESMNYQALFNSMSTSMGLDRDVAYKISENFTKLGYDLASLYNTETDKAMQKLQSGLSGASTRPLRAFGIDITQNTLANTLSDLGIDRSISQLSQAEKMVVRYISVLRQASIAHGDFANTIQSPANQLRIFQAQCLAFKQNIGNLWQGIYAKWMPYINGILMAINALIKVIGGFFGIKFGTSVGSVTEGLKAGAGGAGGIASGLKDATGSAKDLKEELDLMPWDEIHNIDLGKDSSSGGGSSGGGGGGGGGIDPALLSALDAMGEYDNLMSKVENKATSIRDKLMDWLGFEKLVNAETGEIEWKLKEGYQIIELIRDILEGIALGTLAIKLSKLFLTPEQLERWKTGVSLLDKIRTIAGAITFSIGVVTAINGLKGNDLKEKLLGIVETSIGAGLMFKSWKAGVLTLKIATALTFVASSVDWVMDNSAHSKEFLFGDKEDLSFGETLEVANYSWWSGLMQEIGGLLGATPEQSQEAWDQMWIDFSKDCNESLTGVANDIDSFLVKWNFFKDTVTDENAWKQYWEDTKTGAGIWRDDMISSALGFETTWEEVKTASTDPSAWAQYWENVKTGAGIWRDDMLSKAFGFETNWEEVKTTVTDKKAWEQYWEDVKTGAGIWKEDVLKKFEDLKTKAIQKWEDIKAGVTGKIEEAKKNVKEAIDRIRTFFEEKFQLKIKIPKFNIEFDTNGVIAEAFQKMGLPGLPKLKIEWAEFADGGFPSNGELFLAREAGPELVGTMNGRNAVANNDQIIEGIKAGVYEAVASAMSQYGGVQIEAKIEEGILLKKVQKQASQYRMQTGKAPFPTM